MTNGPALCPHAFDLPGGPTGALLIHGLTGSPPEMRPLGDYLAAHGVSVSAPLLPGHGTCPEDLEHTSWEDWYQHVEASYEERAAGHESVFVVGFSLGALLAVHLAARHRVAGVAALSPGLQVRDWKVPFVRYLKAVIRFVPKDLDPNHSDLADKSAFALFWQYPCWPTESVHQLVRLQQVVRGELRQIMAPAFVAYSTGDTSIHPQSGPTLFRELASADKVELVLHKSGHGILVDAEKATLFDALLGWITAHAWPGRRG
ncbi:MAG: Thermostable monoacylglycerol lipase [Chloroflexi bacterium ADurb.Bin180]|nr:MAG: Thermostable monoacylglycerol lipase [Chloroflexi bacterium ADurb.Bin180]